MTARDWKVGDVAMVARDGEWQRAVCESYPNSHLFYWLFPDRARRFVDGTPARPLVVIDPENDEDVRRVQAALGLMLTPTSRTQAALRSLVEPPKPPEPTGLGAVVEDTDGIRWTRVEAGYAATRNPWYPARDSALQPREWSEINAVRVLSEGVSS